MKRSQQLCPPAVFKQKMENCNEQLDFSYLPFSFFFLLPPHFWENATFKMIALLLKLFCSIKTIFLCSNFYPQIKAFEIHILSVKYMWQKYMGKTSRNCMRIFWGYPLPVLAKNVIIGSSRDHVAWGFVLCNSYLFIFLNCHCILTSWWLNKSQY